MEEIYPGQRELEVGGTFVPTEEEAKILEGSNVSAAAVQSFVDASGAKQTINAAIGGLALKNNPPQAVASETPVEAAPEQPEQVEKTEEVKTQE